STPTEKQPRGFGIDPQGRYMVVSGEKSETISVYAIDGASGALALLQKYPTGKGANWVEMVRFDGAGREEGMPTVECGIGAMAGGDLGPTLMHEHIVTRSPGVQENWPHLWDRDAILALGERKMADLHARGIRSIVDLTTVDLGRDIDLI